MKKQICKRIGAFALAIATAISVSQTDIGLSGMTQVLAEELQDDAGRQIQVNDQTATVNADGTALEESAVDLGLISQDEIDTLTTESTGEYGITVSVDTTVYVDDSVTETQLTSYKGASSDYWGKFSSWYYYNQMNSSEQALYMSFYSQCMSLLTGSATASSTAFVTCTGLTTEQIVNVALVFVNSNPQFYFVNDALAFRYSTDAAGNTITSVYLCLYEAFWDGSTRTQCTNAFKSKIDALTQRLSCSSTSDVNTKVSTESTIYNYIADTVTYQTETYDQCSYSAIVDLTSVCAGYSEAFELFCSYAGIDCIVVTSYAHEWNEVKLGDNWYLVDVTWGDTSGNKSGFLNISENNSNVNDSSHKYIETVWTTYNRPVCYYNYGNSQTSSQVGSTAMYRLYNPNSGEHFYTASVNERNTLIYVGWNYEGIAWYAPNEGEEVYRLYNPNAGDHHYTTSAGERNALIAAGWNYEGVAWYSGGSTPIYRAYNPNATGSGAHHYTTSANEIYSLWSIGWSYEGIGWYGVQ